MDRREEEEVGEASIRDRISERVGVRPVKVKAGDRMMDRDGMG